MRDRTRRLIGWALVLGVPALTWSGYVYVSRMMRSFSPAADFAALAVSVAIGALGIVLLYRVPGQRAVALVTYVVLASAGMYFGMVGSTCYLGDCP